MKNREPQVLYLQFHIKFDMELLRHLDDNNGANRKVLKALVGLCAEMNIRTLTEGVEKGEQLEFLKEIDCEIRILPKSLIHQKINQTKNYY